MSAERELGDALLKLEKSGIDSPSDGQRLANKIFTRDRRRIRILGGLAILFSLLSAGAFYAMFDLLVNRTIPAVIRSDDRLNKIEAGIGSTETSAKRDETEVSAEKSEAEKEQIRAPRPKKWYHSNTLVQWLGIAASSMFVLAVASTVWLILVSRRTALRQINVSLLEISRRLEQLQHEK